MKSKNVESTARLARELARDAGGPRAGKACVYALVGELGTGKTTFTQEFAKTLGVKTRITSPSFLVMKKYPLEGEKMFIHIDAYRLNTPEELLKLGFKNLTEDPRNIIVVEWADKVKNILPHDTKWLRFSHGKKENERYIESLS